jgi:hypothetical protein
MAVNNIYVTNAVWHTAEMAIADNWDSVYGNAANRNYYALYAVTKAMRLARPRPVTYLEKTFIDWYNDDTRACGKSSCRIRRRTVHGRPGTMIVARRSTLTCRPRGPL